MKSSGANDVIQIAAKNATTVITTFQRRWTDTLSSRARCDLPARFCGNEHRRPRELGREAAVSNPMTPKKILRDKESR